MLVLFVLRRRSESCHFDESKSISSTFLRILWIFYPFINHIHNIFPQVSIHQSDGNGSITCFHSSALKFLGISNDEAQKLAKENRTRGNPEIYRICKKTSGINHWHRFFSLIFQSWSFCTMVQRSTHGLSKCGWTKNPIMVQALCLYKWCHVSRQWCMYVFYRCQIPCVLVWIGA